MEVNRSFLLYSVVCSLLCTTSTVLCGKKKQEGNVGKKSLTVKPVYSLHGTGIEKYARVPEDADDAGGSFFSDKTMREVKRKSFWMLYTTTNLALAYLAYQDCVQEDDCSNKDYVGIAACVVSGIFPWVDEQYAG